MCSQAPFQARKRGIAALHCSAARTRARAPAERSAGALAVSQDRSVARLAGPAAVGRAARRGELALLGLSGGEALALGPLLELDVGRVLDGGEEAPDRPPGAADLVHLLG